MKRLVLFVLCGLALISPVDAWGGVGRVEGTVTPVEWAQEVEVCVYEDQPAEFCTAPTADGSYVLHEVPFGQVVIEFLPSFRSRLTKQYYDNVSRIREATPIVLNEGNLVEVGVDANLEKGAVIEGTVTSAGSGDPLSEVEVCAVSSSLPTVRSCGETGATGEYELHSLPTEAYDVGFWGAGKNANYEPFHRLVFVNAATVTTGFDASLSRGAQIEGAVTAAADGRPLEGVPVCLFEASEGAAERCTESDQSGDYRFQGLPGGSYQVGFSLGSAEISGTGTAAEVGGFVPQYYDGVTTRAVATPISLLTAQTVEDVDAALSTPPVPSAPQAAPLITNPITATASAVAQPKPKPRKLVCKKPKRRRKVKGKVRCVKPSRSRHKKAANAR